MSEPVTAFGEMDNLVNAWRSFYNQMKVSSPIIHASDRLPLLDNNFRFLRNLINPFNQDPTILKQELTRLEMGARKLRPIVQRMEALMCPCTPLKPEVEAAYLAAKRFSSCAGRLWKQSAEGSLSLINPDLELFVQYLYEGLTREGKSIQFADETLAKFSLRQTPTSIYLYVRGRFVIKGGVMTFTPRTINPGKAATILVVGLATTLGTQFFI